ncbi:MAG: ParB/RepB/Spo0J family partition protein [Candidatus Omnitrophica bacterium]|nr:ParB/RepB/Spo0J family partition protein [Candidatus Omnitrophota bacterium]
MEKRALGKGLSALIPPKEVEQGQQEKVLQIPLSQIKTSKYQPRVEFNKERLEELISSIKEKGVIQPILVRRSADGYELIAGERRLRAAKALDIERLPAIVRDVQDIDMLELSLIENIQREELNPIEEANAFQKFITDFKFTQEKIAQVLGKDRSTIANTIRLLNLPKKIQEFISREAITAGHAKALLSLPTENEQLRVCNLVIKKGLSVRETENLVARRTAGTKSMGSKKDKDANIIDIENRLQNILGTRVKIFHGKSRGRIQIEYYSNEDLNRLLDIFSRVK